MRTRTRCRRAAAAAIAIGLGGAAPAWAVPAAEPAPQRDVSVNIIAPVAGLVISTLVAQDVLPLGVELEQRLGASWTGYVGPGIVLGTLYGRPLLGGTLSVGARFYPASGAPAGFWLGPEATGTLTSGLGGRSWTGSLSVFAGYNALFLGRVLLSPGVGVGLRAGTLGLGPLPAVRLNVGYAF